MLPRGAAQTLANGRAVFGLSSRSSSTGFVTHRGV